MIDKYSEFPYSKKNNKIQSLISLKQTPRKTVVQNDETDQSNNRLYVSACKDPHFFCEQDKSKLSEQNVTQYLIGGWVRWLSFIDNTYDNQNLPSVIFRLISRAPSEDMQDVGVYEDRMAYVTATSDSYSFCVHDSVKEIFDLCKVFNYSGLARENSWHFLLLMFDYDSNYFYAKVRINGEWAGSKTNNIQKPFDGFLGLYLAGDVFKEGRTGFNGEMANWNVFYGKKFFDIDEFDCDPDAFLEKKFGFYQQITYVDKIVEASCNKITQKPDDYSTFTFLNTFFEAQDYGIGVWLKVSKTENSVKRQKQQILTLAFDNSDQKINTTGRSITQVYLENEEIFVEVIYEKNNEHVSVAKKVDDKIENNWFYLQIHFSTSNMKIIASIVKNGVSQMFEWCADSILIPKNLYLIFGMNTVLEKEGADFKYKNAVVYAGEHVLYDESVSTLFLEKSEKKKRNGVINMVFKDGLVENQYKRIFLRKKEKKILDQI